MRIPRVSVLAAIVPALLCLFLPASRVLAQPASSGGDPVLENESAEMLVVLTKEAEPFVMRGEAGAWSGLSIELWRRVAERLGVATEFREATLDEMLANVESGDADAAIAAITITPTREEALDFSHPYYSAGLAIAVPHQGGAGVWLNVLRAVVSPAFLQAVAALGAVLLIAGLLVWLFERKQNQDEFGGGVTKGVASGFWWSAVTMTTVGYGDKAPRTLGGRIVALVWMYASVIIIAAFTGGLASALTVGTLAGNIQGADDLPGARVGVVEQTVASEAMERDGVGAERYESLQNALDAMADGQLDAVVHDAPILRWAVRQSHAGDLRVLQAEFDPQDYGIALPQGSELREPVSQAVLEVVRTDAWKEAVRRYAGR